MWFERKGDARLGRCDSDNCGGAPTWRLEADGVGSNYCSGCKERIERSSLPSYDPELWRMPDDRIWALKAAADPRGMMPNAETTAKFLKTMELEGLVRQSDVAPVWFITDLGRTELAALTQS